MAIVHRATRVIKDSSENGEESELSIVFITVMVQRERERLVMAHKAIRAERTRRRQREIERLSTEQLRKREYSASDDGAREKD